MRRLPHVGVILVLCCACALAASPKRTSKWIEIRTAHFRILTDGEVERAISIGAELECLRETLDDEIVRRTEADSSRPLTVIAFRRGSELRQVAPLYHGKAVRLDGLYQDGERMQFIAVDASTQILPHVIAHEYSHFRMETRDRSYPVWLLEGLSDYLAAVATRAPARKMAFGSQIVLDQLFSLREDSREYNEEDFHRAFYADASTAAEYFWTNADQKKRLHNYLKLIAAGMPLPDAIKEAFGSSTEELSLAIRSFADQQRAPRDSSIGCSNETPAEVLPVSDIEARVHLAEFKAQVAGHLADAIRDFEAILQQQPNDARALRGLAYALWQSGDTARASRYFGLAAASDPTDHYLPYLRAVLLRLQGADRNVELRREMQAALSASIALKPAFADAHHWLSLTYAWDGDFEAASREAKDAVELDPTNDGFKFNLASFYAHARRLSEARSVYEELRKNSDKDVASRAESLFHRLDEAQ